MSDDVQIEAQFERDEIIEYELPDPSPSPPEKQPQDQIPREQSQERLPIATTRDKSPEVASMVNNMSLGRNRPLEKRKAPASADQEAQISRPGKILKAGKLQRDTVIVPPIISQAPGRRLGRPTNALPGARPPVKTGSDPFNIEQAYREDDQKDDQMDDHVDRREDRPEQFQSIAINGSPSKNPTVILGALRNIPELVSTSTNRNTPGDDDRLDDEADKPINAAGPPSSPPAAPRRSTRVPQKPINRSMPGGNQQSNGTKVSKPQSGAASRSPVHQKRLKNQRGRPKGSASSKAPQSKATGENTGHNPSNQNVDLRPRGTPKKLKVNAATATSIQHNLREPRPSKRATDQPYAVPTASESHEESEHDVAGPEEADRHDDDGHTVNQHDGAEYLTTSTNQAPQVHNENDTGGTSTTFPSARYTDREPSSQRARPIPEESQAAEDDASYPAPISSSGEDCPELSDIPEEFGLELFGMDDAWRKIKTQLRKVGTRKKPHLKKGCISKLFGVVEEAIQAYALPVPESSPESSVLDELAERQRKLVENVEASITGISETEFKGNKNNVLQDIYFHAIPQMMALLDKALKARTVQLSKKRDTSALEEIIRIQEMSANLCRKASRRKAKLSTKRPVKQTINAIGPQLKSLLKKFNAELRERKRCLNQRENDAKRAKLRRLEEESDRQAWQEVQRVKQARNQEIWEAISQKPVGPRPGMAVLLSQARNQEAERRRGQAQWTEEQDVQLFIEFFANGLEDLSVEARCLRVLSAPSLDNKLPEHIRERIVYYKEALELTLSSKGCRVPEWLPALE
ncbi:MAG: hypothetical protein L6R35_000414 [Caloplaca aegaea]|nr:MAG: hypothetical protein L6R35_000414 [Caloplaca aegaea]